ncbi:HAMP domain-containing protein [Luteibacter pinisoli]|uniref:histidine kinase n=1 Tax=Luteibacter pinisoli TaxID=2589080 RepID=A0A4Y5YZ71_9GAMM|nr:HAMP domain-containing protein [Luteibacter pinisoli]
MMRIPRMSIFARSFLMMSCALLVAEAIGFLVFSVKPPRPTASAGLFDIVAALRPDLQAFGHPFDGGRGPGEMGPPGGFGPPHGTDIEVAVASAPPVASDGYDEGMSSHVAERLAGMLATDRTNLRVFATTAGFGPIAGPMRATIGPGSVIALRQDDGTWRVASVPPMPFTDTVSARLLWMLGLGLLVMLPLAGLFASALSSPIRRFAEAAHRLGGDSGAPPVPREGPTEMRQAVDAFNAMQARMNRMMQERTHMIAAIAHDLRTPLTRLSFRLDGLPAPLGEKVDADIQEMRTMIAAALDFIRDRSSGAHRQPLDFRLLVESVADDLVDVGHDVALQAGQPITVDGDPLALRRVVMNLVENGLKYGDRVRMRLRFQGEACILEVDDDGPGIPEMMQRQVFEPFFRLEASRNRDTGGIGLGLASVRAIVSEHGGQVELRNRREGGLRASVTLPARLHA